MCATAVVTPSFTYYNPQDAESVKPVLRESICDAIDKEALDDARTQAFQDAGRAFGVLRLQGF
jgi:hypothetical protein